MTRLADRSTAHAASVTAAVHGPRLTADERRAEIIEAAVKAFASGGLAGTSTEEIARLAGVSQPYLFRLFGTKRDLFIAAVGRAFDRIADTFTAAATAAATTTADAGPPGISPALLAIARSYHQLLRDPSLLRLQLHSFAACDDAEIRAYVRARYAGLVRLVAVLS
ncbi:MAG TPA: helix-turn-helix domain-containing protein, partial [Candidatus Limnocylindrales bacterium]|nr:helix-turn-helix domain-containing protein [Candidatus Limnocylindrales bacterium]